MAETTDLSHTNDFGLTIAASYSMKTHGQGVLQPILFLGGVARRGGRLAHGLLRRFRTLLLTLERGPLDYTAVVKTSRF